MVPSPLEPRSLFGKTSVTCATKEKPELTGEAALSLFKDAGGEVSGGRLEFARLRDEWCPRRQEQHVQRP